MIAGDSDLGAPAPGPTQLSVGAGQRAGLPVSQLHHAQESWHAGVVDDTSRTRRGTWDDLPDGLRASITAFVGADVLDVEASEGGFSVDAVIGVLHGAKPIGLFLKAVPEHHPSAMDYRLEAEILAQMPSTAPTAKLHLFVECEGWIALVMDALPGHVAQEPWTRHDLTATLEALHRVPSHLDEHVALQSVAGRMAGRCSYFTESHGMLVDTWSREHLERLTHLETVWADLVVGDEVVHFDLRHDNCWILPSEQAVLLDWGRACRGPRWVDLVCLMLLSNTGDLPPEELLSNDPTWLATRPEAVDAFLVALLSYWTRAAAGPPVDGAPTLRARQERSQSATQQWLRSRWST